MDEQIASTCFKVTCLIKSPKVSQLFILSFLQRVFHFNACRGVEIRFANNDNITAVIEGFLDFYELYDEGVKTQILRLAKHGMHPGTFLV